MSRFVAIMMVLGASIIAFSLGYILAVRSALKEVELRLTGEPS
jgi:hypothetical protein